MLNIRVLLMPQVRCISTFVKLHGKHHMMNKILSGPRKHKKYIYNNAPIVSTTNSLKSVTNDSKKSVNTKRINILNKLFMRHITDLMSTGTYSHAFTGHGIEINRVKVSSDFKRVRVYWLSRSDKLVENIDEILKSHASGLRHELSQLRVMGVVPKIEFVKDVQFTLLKLLDDKLSQADYGEDHETIDNTSKLKKELELQTNLEQHVRKQIENLEEGAEEYLNDVPNMAQNVLGLNHADIMLRVMKQMKKSQAPHRQLTNNSTENLYVNVINPDPIVYSSMRLQREAFKDFLNKRQLMKQKLHKPDKTYRPEMDYLEEEWEKQREANLKKYDLHEYLLDDKDYISEETEDNQK